MRLRALVILLLLALPIGLRADSLQVVALPIVVHSAESDPRYVSEGLADMLSARLEQLRGVRVVTPGDSSPATVKLEEALEIGREAGGDYVIFGKIIRGMDILKEIAEGDFLTETEDDSGQGVPARDLLIESTKLKSQ